MKIIICGDYCPQFKVTDLLESGNFSSVLGNIRFEISSADYSIVNMECPVVVGDVKPIIKNGPSLKCSPRGIECLRWAGFNCVTLANNHFLDYGEEGVKMTLNTIKNYGMDCVGGGVNEKDASSVLFKRIGEETLSIINCCEHEFSIASEKSAGSNPINPISQYYKIRESKEKSDYCIVVVHGGIEHYNLPTQRLQEYCRFLIDVGANAVICHHQHCFSGYEEYHGGVIFYGLGNFCFDGNRANGNDSWHLGYMVKITFNKESFDHSIIPYVQCKETPSVCILEGTKKEEFFSDLWKINEIIKSPLLIKNMYLDFVHKGMPIYEEAIAPYNNRYLNALRRRGLIPSFFTNKKIIKLRNFIECESHRDILIEVLNRISIRFK